MKRHESQKIVNTAKVTKVSFSMLRTTQRFENDRAHCEVEVGGTGTQQDIDEAYALARAQCALALGKPLVDVNKAVAQAKKALDAIGLPAPTPAMSHQARRAAGRPCGDDCWICAGDPSGRG